MKVQSEITNGQAVPCTKQTSLISPKPKPGSRGRQAGEEASPLGPPPTRPPPPPLFRLNVHCPPSCCSLGWGRGPCIPCLGSACRHPPAPPRRQALPNPWGEGLCWEFLDSGTWVDGKLSLEALGPGRGVRSGGSPWLLGLLPLHLCLPRVKCRGAGSPVPTIFGRCSKLFTTTLRWGPMVIIALQMGTGDSGLRSRPKVRALETV